MITLDYRIHSSPPTGTDLRHVGQSELHYDEFLGDIVFRVNGADMSAQWGWIPIVDFAACLHRIGEELQARHCESFEFTESEHRIDFKLTDDMLEIGATYAVSSACVGLNEFRQKTGEFLRRVLDDLSRANPTLNGNEYFQLLYPRSDS